MYPVLKHEELTKGIINEAYYVHRQLGHGFLESIYHKALFMRLTKAGMNVKYEAPLSVCFDGTVIGEFAADLVVEDKVIVEIKAVEIIHPRHACAKDGAASGGHGWPGRETYRW